MTPSHDDMGTPDHDGHFRRHRQAHRRAVARSIVASDPIIELSDHLTGRLSASVEAVSRPLLGSVRPLDAPFPFFTFFHLKAATRFLALALALLCLCSIGRRRKAN